MVGLLSLMVFEASVGFLALGSTCYNNDKLMGRD